MSKTAKAALLRSLSKKLERSRLTSGYIQRILHARVPILKFTWAASGAAVKLPASRDLQRSLLSEPLRSLLVGEGSCPHVASHAAVAVMLQGSFYKYEHGQGKHALPATDQGSGYM